MEKERDENPVEAPAGYPAGLLEPAESGGEPPVGAPAVVDMPSVRASSVADMLPPAPAGWLESGERWLGRLIVMAALAAGLFLYWQSRSLPERDLENDNIVSEAEKAPAGNKAEPETELINYKAVAPAALLLCVGVAYFGLYVRRLGFAAPAFWHSQWGMFDCVKAAGFLFLAMLALLGVTGRDGNGQVTANFLAEGLVLLYVGWFLWVKGVQVKQFGLWFPPRWWAMGVRAYLAFLPVFFCAILVSMVLWQKFTGEAEPQTQEVVQLLTGPGLSDQVAVCMLWFAIVGAPVAEEILFRGLMFGALRRYLSWPLAALVSGLAFGSMHGDLMRLAPLALFGWFLAYLRERTGSLTVPMLVHLLNNLVMVVMTLSPWL